jgi:hypothetical protein
MIIMDYLKRFNESTEDDQHWDNLVEIEKREDRVVKSIKSMLLQCYVKGIQQGYKISNPHAGGLTIDNLEMDFSGADIPTTMDEVDEFIDKKSKIIDKMIREIPLERNKRS